ncbi:MAG TPA: hypothetical protein VJT73_17570 [Polyangiaceae bacterium]|nr:hypothetical protein [Polyangiaceae bacterium]
MSSNRIDPEWWALEARRLRAPHVGVAISAGFGLAISTYFALEAEDIVPSVLERWPLLAKLFSEDRRAHFNVVSSSWLRAFLFAVALAASVACMCQRPPPARLLRMVYTSSALGYPALTVAATVIQPFFRGAFCFACLIETVASLALLEFAKPALKGATSAARQRTYGSAQTMRGAARAEDG